MKTSGCFLTILLLFSCQRAARTQKADYRSTPKQNVMRLVAAEKNSLPSEDFVRHPAFRHVSEFGKFLGIHEEHFELSTVSDTVIRGKGGTIISIPAHSFTDAYGRPAENITINFIEVTTPLQMVSQDLSCITTEGKLLSSGGSFFLEALSDGKKLELAADVQLVAQFPVCRSFKNDMQAFSGVQQGNRSWKWEATCPPASLSGKEKEERSVSGKGYNGYAVNSFACERYLTFDKLHKFSNCQLGNALLADGSGTFNNWLSSASIRKNRVLSDYFEQYKFRVKIDLMFKGGKAWNIRSNPGVDSVFLHEILAWMQEAPAFRTNQVTNYHWYECVISTRAAKPFTEMELWQLYRWNNRCRVGESPYSRDYYEIPVTNLGWINCDRYATFEGEKIALSVEHDPACSVYVIVPTINSGLLPSGSEKGLTKFPELPENLKVKVVAVKMLGKQLYASVISTQIDAGVIKIPKVVKMSRTELQQSVNS